jgi:uncharacterized phage infection (PIP) family protein YhgE
MAEAMTMPLRGNPDVIKLLDLFKTNGYESEHQEYSALLDYVETVENRYNSILDELTALREQISGIADRKNPLAIIAERLSSAVSGLGAKLKAIKDSIVEFAQNTLGAARDKGLSAIGAVSGKLRIRDGLEAISKGLGKAAATMESLEQFRQERVAVKDAAEAAAPTAAQTVSLSELLGDTRVDFENLSPDELKATYGKLLSIGMDNDLTASELSCLQYLTEEAESLLPDRDDAGRAHESENELDQGEEI